MLVRNRPLIALYTIAGLAAKTIAGTTSVNAPNYPLTVTDAVNLALRQNPTILNQIQEIKRNQGLVLQAQAALLPQVQGTGNYSQAEPSLVNYAPSSSSPSVDAQIVPINHPPGFKPSTWTTLVLMPVSSQSYIGINKSWNLQITITQLLWDGGAALASRREARLNEEAAYYALRDVIDSVVESVRVQFYRILVDRGLVQVQEEAVNLLKSDLDDQQGRFNSGTATRFDVLQAETEVQNELPALITAQRNYLLARATLAKTLGIAAGPQYSSEEPLPVTGSLAVESFQVDLEKALTLARVRRPLLKADRTWYRRAWQIVPQR
jgi:outer membrane protein TolC